MLDLLLNEEIFLQYLEEIEEFATENEIEFDGSSQKIVEVATVLMLSEDLDMKSFVMLAKVIYNVGYRDNHFKSPNIH